MRSAPHVCGKIYSDIRIVRKGGYRYNPRYVECMLIPRGSGKEMGLRRMKKQKQEEKRAGLRILAAAILLAASAVLMVTAAQVPEFAEWYSRTIYPWLVAIVGRGLGIVPFSVAELCLYLLLIWFAVSAVFLIKGCIRYGNGGRRTFSWFSGVILAVGILAFLYTVGCGINYHRESFSEEEGIVTFRYSTEELKEVCVRLTEEVNILSGEISRGESGIMELDAPEGEGAVEAMEKLAETFSSLEGYYPQPKAVMLSEILSYQGLSGVYSPFTVEANYNGDMTAYNKPFTVCHELSHLRGFMEEKEANFIAFLACTGSERPDFRYSGYLSGWVYCMNALYRTDPEVWQEVRETLALEAEPDLAANNAFWDRYEGVISETSDLINDTYLKANGQTDGVRSYDRMVDLIVAYHSRS